MLHRSRTLVTIYFSILFLFFLLFCSILCPNYQLHINTVTNFVLCWRCCAISSVIVLYVELTKSSWVWSVGICIRLFTTILCEWWRRKAKYVLSAQCATLNWFLLCRQPLFFALSGASDWAEWLTAWVTEWSETERDRRRGIEKERERDLSHSMDSSAQCTCVAFVGSVTLAWSDFPLANEHFLCGGQRHSYWRWTMECVFGWKITHSLVITITERTMTTERSHRRRVPRGTRSVYVLLLLLRPETSRQAMRHTRVSETTNRCCRRGKGSSIRLTVNCRCSKNTIAPAIRVLFCCFVRKIHWKITMIPGQFEALFCALSWNKSHFEIWKNKIFRFVCLAKCCKYRSFCICSAAVAQQMMPQVLLDLVSQSPPWPQMWRFMVCLDVKIANVTHEALLLVLVMVFCECRWWSHVCAIVVCWLIGVFASVDTVSAIADCPNCPHWMNCWSPLR